ncbi:hypothetical protein H0H92_008459 [Tricholoma furcatifolium]|nr:hypothetical protein H0H92_008459 [Tricholoma furcatifolium]
MPSPADVSNPITGIFIPEEIFDHILDHVAASQFSLLQLKACSLVSRALRDSAQEHIFRSLTINIPFDLVSKDMSILSARLRSSVKKLSILLDRRVSEWDWFPEYSDVDGSTFEAIQFSNVINLRLSHCEYAPDPQRLSEILDWPQIPLQIRRLTYSVMRSPTLRSLEIVDIKKFPASAVQACSQIKCLCIHDSDFVADDIRDELPSAKLCGPGYLESFTFSGIPTARPESLPLIQALRDPLSPLTLLRIRKLQTSLRGEFPDFYKLVVELSGRYLQEVELNIDNSFNRNLLVPLRPEIVTKVTFVIRSHLSLVNIASFLSSITSKAKMNRRRDIIIEMSGYELPDMMAELQPAWDAQEVWRLDYALAEMYHATNFRSVRMTEVTVESEESTRDCLMELMPRFMPLCNVHFIPNDIFTEIVLLPA